MDKLEELRGVWTIKIVTGIRRCGKTFLIFNLFRDHLKSNGIRDDHILEYRMDLLENDHLCDNLSLYNDIKSHITDSDMYYILIDEIQNIEEFHKLLNSLLHIDNADVYVTGSNSKFLSKDVVTEFRGRSMEIRVRPLSFREFAEAKGTDLRDCLDEYMDYGGMPELFQYDSPGMKTDYLKMLMSKVYLTDVVERNNIRNDADLENLVDLLCSSIGSLNNISKIVNTLNTKNRSEITNKTVKSYLDDLCDAYMFERSMRYDVKGKRYFDSQSKYYISDVGLKNARENFRQAERTHIMENIIYNELRMAGYDVDVGMVSMTRTTNGKRKKIDTEIDFVANKGNDRIYIQSAFDLNDNNRERETRSLLSVNDSFRKAVIINGRRRPAYDKNGVLWIGLLDFLMNPECISSGFADR